MKKRETKEV